MTTAHRRRFAGLIFALALGLVAFLAPAFAPASVANHGGRAALGRAVAPPVAQAALISHDLAVKTEKGQRIRVCTHWGASNGETQADTCSPNGSATKYDWLYAGQWSDRLHPSDPDWDDVDGYLVPAGCRMRESVIGVDLKLNGYHRVPRFHKISPRVSEPPPVPDHTRKLYLQCR